MTVAVVTGRHCVSFLRTSFEEKPSGALFTDQRPVAKGTWGRRLAYPSTICFPGRAGTFCRFTPRLSLLPFATPSA
jgi:hypothetical protein